MIVSHKHKLIFTHIPKNAGTSTDNDHSTPANRVLLAEHRELILSHLRVDFERFGYAPNFDRTKG